MGKAVARPHKTKAETAAEAQRALELHLAGVPSYHACQQLGISKSTYHRRIRWAMTFRIAPKVDEYRQEQNARLDMYQHRLLEELARPAGMLLTDQGAAIPVGQVRGTDAAAVIGKLLAIEERRARLNGLDAPTKVDHNVRVQDSFATLLDELAQNDPTKRQEQTT